MIRTYDALCLKEPWLELILLGIKTLESRTKCMRKKSGPVVLTSALQLDEVAWVDPNVGGLLDGAAKGRARSGVGRLAGMVGMSGFRPGIPEVEDKAACIQIRLSPRDVRWVSEVSNPRRVVRSVVVRLAPDGRTVAGSSQGFFRVPVDLVVFA